MSHVCGTVPDVANYHIGPDSGPASNPPNLWAKPFAHDEAPTGTKFVVLHFKNVTLPANNRLEVDLGYDTDVFTSASGVAFWTRPINVAAVGASIPIRYITNGANTGGAFIDRYGRGESLDAVLPNHNSITNCNPFLVGGWQEPDFPHIAGSTDPRYDSFWICNKAAAPKWANIRCAGAASVQRQVAPSVGMIVTIHEADPPDHPFPTVSTCSVTLIDSDLVVTAAHCIEHFHFEVPTSSVTFDYEVQCNGGLLPAYNAVFFKVIKLVKFRFTDGRDYAVLQLRGAPPVPSVPVRITDVVLNEDVFGVHHPNGAVKKVSPASGMAKVTATGSLIDVNLDVAGGSSGSGLFDASGNIVGVLAHGPPCDLSYSAMKTMMDDPIVVPNPPVGRAVMLVLDRSGSMSGSAGGGKVKMNEARAAAELFISMVRTTGNRAGIVSFSSNASNPVDFTLKPVDGNAKTQMINKLGGISPGGATSIGDGLIAGRDQLSGAMGLPKAMLVLTDGMENTPQMIADVTGLGGIEITAVGFGSESNLDGPRLTKLAQDHGGLYKRAGDGLELRKFFALAFGEIFEAGALADPQMHLGEDKQAGPYVPFDVCAEEAVTIVVGWNNESAPLLIELATPSGQIVNLGAGGVETSSGTSWRFARVPLPQNGEREGVWKTRVFRPGGGSVEFPPAAPPVDYFINVIARGGPSLRPFAQPKRLYTGDVLHPKVILQFADESTPPGGKVTFSLRRPMASVGTLLAQNGLGSATVIDGDVVPARQATLQEIEKKTGKPATGYIEAGYTMSSAPSGSGSFRSGGVYGRRLENVLVVDGTYTFHAKARVGLSCTTTRECQWSHHVAVGIDPESTPVSTTPGGTGPGGGDRVTVTFTPKDRYGNHVGPGAGGEFEVTPLPGSNPVGVLVDNGDGSYSQDVEVDPDGGEGPGIVISQPDRDPVVVAPATAERKRFRYTATLICGVEPGDCCSCASIAPGRYATAITVYNPGRTEAILAQRVIPTTFAGATSGRWPDSAPARAADRIALPPGEATTIDCCSVGKLLLGAAGPGDGPATYGLVALESSQRVDVTATYTLVTADGASPSIDVERIEPTEAVIREDRPKPPPPPPAPSRPRVPPPRPQDVPRRERTKEPQEKPPRKKKPAKGS